jgi:mannose-6-phosphate isomerase-like protein (cupin superfamily)
MGFDATTRPFVARGSDDSGVPFGSSGRGRLRVYTQWADETGVALVNGVDQSGEPRIRDHVHSRHDETFVVIQGTYRVRLDDKIVTVEAGEIVFVPRGTAHTFRHVGPDSGRMLNVISPADGAYLLRELAEKMPTGLSEAELIEIHDRHGAVLVDRLANWPEG